MSIIEVEGNEYVVRRLGRDDRRPRTEAALRALRADYARYLPGGDDYGLTPLMFDGEAAAEREAENAYVRAAELDTEPALDSFLMEAYDDRYSDEGE